LHPNQSVYDALATFAKHNITAVPVGKDESNVIGFVDTLDVLSFLVKTCTKILTRTEVGESRSLETDDVKMLSKRAKDFKLSDLEKIIDMSKRDPYETVGEGENLSAALPKFQQGIHRVGVLDKNGKLVGVLTQGKVIRKLLDTWNRNVAVKDVKLKSEKIISVPPHMKVIDAFLKMQEDNLSSIAVIDGSVLVGTLSSSDLRVLLNYDFPRLLYSVQEFLASIRKEQGKKADFIIHCSPEANFKEAVRLAMDNHVHRIYIVDERMNPKGVISLSDIIKELSSK